MKKSSKRVLALALAMSTLLTACGGNGGSNADAGTETPSVNTEVVSDGSALAADVITVDMSTYDAKSAEVYNAALGEFITAYEVAKAVDNVSERQALMAIAEAKLLEASVMVPIYAAGGNYAISRIAPYTVPYTLWGGDMEKVYQQLIATEPIKSEDREAMKQKWTELRGKINIL